MRTITLTLIVTALIAATACRSHRSSASAVSAGRTDTVSILYRDSVEIIRTLSIERPRIIIEHTDSPRRRVVITAERIRDSATAVGVTAVAVDSSMHETMTADIRSGSKPSRTAPRWLWLAIGVAGGIILRSCAGIRFRR
ncbi:MAG: hypothetical protein Q4C34_08730 [Bacteroidales bacterium]|nr:hypothetical protein [Bacteroidales bacterium]